MIFNEGLCKIVEQYLKKGSKVYLEGALQTRKWTDKDGNDKYSTEVVLQGFNSSLTMLDGTAAEQVVEAAAVRIIPAAATTISAPAARPRHASPRWPRPAASAATWTTKFRSK